MKLNGYTTCFMSAERPRKLKVGIEPVDRTDPVVAKYARNLFSGLVAAAEERIKPFTGFGSNYHDGITMRNYYNPAFLEALNGSVISTVGECAADRGVDLLTAGEHWRPHTSIAQLLHHDGVTPGDRADSFRRVRDSYLANEAAGILVGVKPEFNFIFLGGNAVTLAATEIPQEVTEARKMMTEVGRNLSMAETDQSNIFHITLSRVQGVRQKSDLRGFAFDLLRLHLKVGRNPKVGVIVGADFIENELMEKLYEKGLPPSAATLLKKD